MNMTRSQFGNITRAGITTLLALFGLASAAAAQETFHACYVPDVGAVYMIKIQGLPQACLSTSHVEFSWTSASAPTDSSITTLMLADGSVTEAKLADAAVSQIKLADGAVSEAKLADGAVTQAKLADAAVGSAQVADSSLTAADLAPASVTAAQIATDAVGTAAIQNGAVSRLKLASASRIIQFQAGDIYNVGTTAANIGSVTVTTSDYAAVILMLTGTAVTMGGQTVVNVAIATVSQGNDVASESMGVLDGTDAIRREFPFSPTGAVIVSAGTHTFYATAYKPSVFSSTTVNLSNVRLTAIVIPN